MLKVFSRSDIVREGTETDLDFGDWLLKECKVTNEEYEQKQQKAKNSNLKEYKN